MAPGATLNIADSLATAAGLNITPIVLRPLLPGLPDSCS
jgi:hypothetical protein